MDENKVKVTSIDGKMTSFTTKITNVESKLDTKMTSMEAQI